jgi:hypothetical protein
MINHKVIKRYYEHYNLKWQQSRRKVNLALIGFQIKNGKLKAKVDENTISLILRMTSIEYNNVPNIDEVIECLI